MFINALGFLCSELVVRLFVTDVHDREAVTIH